MWLIGNGLNLSSGELYKIILWVCSNVLVFFIIIFVFIFSKYDKNKHENNLTLMYHKCQWCENWNMIEFYESCLFKKIMGCIQNFEIYIKNIKNNGSFYDITR